MEPGAREVENSCHKRIEDDGAEVLIQGPMLGGLDMSKEVE
jgi:hypothetical protein